MADRELVVVAVGDGASAQTTARHTEAAGAHGTAGPLSTRPLDRTPVQASLDSRWRTFWQQEVSDSGLWRWAKADGEGATGESGSEPRCCAATHDVHSCP